MKVSFDFKPLLESLKFWTAFLAFIVFPAVTMALCLCLPMLLSISISWLYLFLYLVTIPIFVGIILLMCCTIEEDNKNYKL